MIPGTVDRRTGNVPLRLEGGYDVHFHGRDESGRLLVRLARSTVGPIFSVADAAELHEHLKAALPAAYAPPGSDHVAVWLDLRATEPASS